MQQSTKSNVIPISEASETKINVANEVSAAISAENTDKENSTEEVKKTIK